MPVKIARSTPRPSFELPELLGAIHISRLASRDAAKSLLSTLVSESSGECRNERDARLDKGDISQMNLTVVTRHSSSNARARLTSPLRQLNGTGGGNTIGEDA
jgi:hypothetical protein